MKINRRDFFGTVAASSLLPLSLNILAATDYPNKVIKAVVPFPPGGGGDTLGRLVFNRLGEELGQAIVIENMPGAGGNLGTRAVARSPADGYSVLYGTNGTHAINASIYKKLSFDPIEDFEPISRFTEIAAIVTVRADLPVASIKELIEYSKKSKAPLSFGSAGNGTTSHLAGEMFKQMTGVEWMHVPYKGGAAALTDLMGGRIDVLIDVAPNVGQHIAGGRIKALAVTTAERSKPFEQLPTVVESGVPGYVVTAWDGLFVPAKTDPAVIDKLTQAVHKALHNPALKEQLAARVAVASPLSPNDFKAFIAVETKRWGDVVKKSGATVD